MMTGKTFKRFVRRTRIRVRMTAEILRHPKTPWYVRGIAFFVVAYALSPIDLIPDFIPVLGYVDDVLLLPLGAALVILTTPRAVRVEAVKAAVRTSGGVKAAHRWIGAAGVIILWLAIASAIALRFFRRMSTPSVR